MATKMAPIIQLCLLALCGALRATASSPTIVDGGEAMIQAINKARNSGLSVTVNEVVEDPDIANEAAGKIKLYVGEDCSKKWDLTVQQVMSLLVFHGPTIEEKDFDNLFQNVVDRGLAVLGPYDEEYLKKWDIRSPPWLHEPASNFAALMWASSTKAGCAYTTDCPRVQVLVCQLEPSLEVDEQPFSLEYFQAVRERNAAREKGHDGSKKGRSGGQRGGDEETEGGSEGGANAAVLPRPLLLTGLATILLALVSL